LNAAPIPSALNVIASFCFGVENVLFINLIELLHLTLDVEPSPYSASPPEDGSRCNSINATVALVLALTLLNDATLAGFLDATNKVDEDIFVVIRLGIVAIVNKALCEVIPVVNVIVAAVMSVVIKLGIVAIVSKALADVIPVVILSVLDVIFVVVKLGIVAVVKMAEAEVIPVVKNALPLVMFVETKLLIVAGLVVALNGEFTTTKPLAPVEDVIDIVDPVVFANFPKNTLVSAFNHILAPPPKALIIMELSTLVLIVCIEVPSAL